MRWVLQEQAGRDEPRAGIEPPQWQRFAGSIAERYYRFLVPVIFEPWAADLVGLAAPGPGERVLDVACGPGVVARHAARYTDPGCVTGIDISPGMIELARSLPGPLGDLPARPAIEWREGNAMALPFPCASFDLVLCQQGVQFFADHAAGVAEMHRVLVPGGRLALAVWGPIEESPGFAALAAALERHAGPDAAAAARSPFALADPAELHGLLAGAGFRDVRVQSRAKVLRFPSAAEFVAQYVGSSPVGMVLGDTAGDRLGPVIDEVTGALAPFTGPDGLSFRIENQLAHAVRLAR